MGERDVRVLATGLGPNSSSSRTREGAAVLAGCVVGVGPVGAGPKRSY